MDDAAKAANGGIDLEMPRADVYGDKLKAAVDSGAVKPEIIDDAVSRLLRQIFRFVGPDFMKGYTQDKIAGAEHKAVARECAEKCMALLKNDGVLPFSLSGIKSLAVLGKLAMEDNLGDHGSSRVTPPSVVTFLDGIKKKAAGIKVSYCSGIPARSKALAEKADAVVVVAGLNFKDEGEGHDRVNMTLHPDEIELIKLAAAANKKTAVVLVGGSAITMEGWLDQAPAVLMAWYPGMEGGAALANILFGDVNPSGKLPIVFPKAEDQLYKFENQAAKVEYKGFHGYRFFDDKGLEPLFPFGFGLSYTKFEYANLKLQEAAIGKDGKLAASVDVKNTGAVAGEEIVFLFAGAKNPPVSRPKKELKAFTRVALKPGEQKTVTLEVPAQELARFCMQGMQWMVDAGEYDVLVGPSADRKSLLSTSLSIKS
jgi:beta-glucosidase